MLKINNSLHLIIIRSRSTLRKITAKMFLNEFDLNQKIKTLSTKEEMKT